jgi:hypothetical protein
VAILDVEEGSMTLINFGITLELDFKDIL